MKIVRRSWTVIPIPDVVIARVNALGMDQPEMLTFTDRQGRPIGDIEITGVDAADVRPLDETPRIDTDPNSFPHEDIEIPQYVAHGGRKIRTAIMVWFENDFECWTPSICTFSTVGKRGPIFLRCVASDADNDR